MKKHLQIQQLNKKIKAFKAVQGTSIPKDGWISAIRTTLGMTLEQLSRKMNVSKQSVNSLEKREREGTISLASLREVAKSMDMQLVYGFVPNDGTLDALIEKKAKEMATRIVMRTSNTMKLEDQENSRARIEKAIKERTAAIKNEMPKSLWD